MTPDPDTTVRDLQDRLATAARHRARAEYEHDIAQAAAATARATLLTEFGVENPEGGTRILADLTRDLATETQALGHILDGLGV